MESKELDKIIGALAAFRKESKYVKPTKVNPFLKNKYADFTSIVNAVQKGLDDNSLFIRQWDTNVDGIPAVATFLHHIESGQFFGGVFPLIYKDHDMQSVGGAITYARRYGYVTLLGLIINDDDDGNTANKLEPKKDPADFTNKKYELAEKLRKKFGNNEGAKAFVHSVLGEGVGINSLGDVLRVDKAFKEQYK